MQILRTALWVIMAVIVSSFVWMNWTPTSVNLWPLADGFLHVDWPVGLVALAFFLLGFGPMWLLAKTARWRFNRRIATLENAVKAASPTPPLASKMLGSATQFDHAQQD